MNASKTKESKEAKTATGKPLDPFAVDFFGKRESTAKENKPNSEAIEIKPLNGNKKKEAKTVKWFERIPHLSRDEFLFSERLEKLPDNLTKAAAHKISETVTRYTFQAPKTVRCQMIAITEVDLIKTLGQFARSPQTFLALGCQPENSTALIAFDTGFVLSVIDLILSGKGEELKIPRKLSPIENTILEFLAGNILAGINDWIGKNVFCLQTIENESSSMFEKNERGAEAVFRLDFADFSGIITLLASKDFLASIDKTSNPLLANKNGRDKFKVFEQIAPQLKLHLQIGATNLDAGSFSYLEIGDIVLIEQPFVNFQNAGFSGGGTVNLGSGENFSLQGRFVQDDILSDGGGELSLKLEEIKSRSVRRRQKFDRLDMDKKETKTAERNRG